MGSLKRDGFELLAGTIMFPFVIVGALLVGLLEGERPRAIVLTLGNLWR